LANDCIAFQVGFGHNQRSMNEYLDLLRRNPNFRNLWLGSVVSQFGDWFNVLAAAELISRLTDSGLALSYLFLARFLPLFLFSPFAGILADRFNRKYIMVVSDILRGLTVLGFLLVRRPEDVWLFYLLTVVQFILSALFQPARSAVLPGIVEKNQIVAANALDSLTWSTMLALGAMVGGLVAAVFGAETAFVADSLTFLLSAVFIGRIILPPRAQDIPIPGTRRRFAFLDGFRYLLNEPFILGIALAKAGGSLVWGAINVLEITYANTLFPLETNGRLSISDGGTATLGLIYVASGIGTGVGPLVMRRWLGDAPRRLMLGISLGFLFLTAGLWWISLVDSLPSLLTATVVRTLGTGTLWVFSAALLQTFVPDRFRGRVFAFEFAALTLTQSISVLAAGALVDAGYSPPQAVAVSAAVCLVVTALWLLFHFRGRVALRSGVVPLRQSSLSGGGNDVASRSDAPVEDQTVS
jgi:MFS family permease